MRRAKTFEESLFFSLNTSTSTLLFLTSFYKLQVFKDSKQLGKQALESHHHYCLSLIDHIHTVRSFFYLKIKNHKTSPGPQHDKGGRRDRSRPSISSTFFHFSLGQRKNRQIEIAIDTDPTRVEKEESPPPVRFAYSSASILITSTLNKTGQGMSLFFISRDLLVVFFHYYIHNHL